MMKSKKARSLFLLSFSLLSFMVSGCHFTYDVNRREAGRDWYYYGDLKNFYHDESGGSPVSVVWWEQVKYVEPKKEEYTKTLRDYFHQGYRKIGYVAVQSTRPLYEEDVKGLACDKGAQIIIASSHPVSSVPGERPEIIDTKTLRHRWGRQRYTFEMTPTSWTKKSYYFLFLGK